MPAAAVAAIQAAATLGSAAMASRTADTAGRRQSKAATNALGHELRGEKRQSQIQDQEWQDYQRRHEEWRQRNFPQGATMSRPGDTAQPRNQPAPAPTAGPPGAPAGQRTLGSLMGMPQPAVPPLVPPAGLPSAMPPTGQPGAPPRTLGDWGDWERYGA